MSKFLSERFSGLRAYVPGEQPRDKKYIKLNTNEFPYPPSPVVFEAINRDCLCDLRLYSDPECKRLKELIAERYKVGIQNVFIGNGSDEVLSYIFMAFCDKNVGVSYPDISYGFYSVFADLYGLRKNEVPLREDFTVAPDDYRELGTTIVIANPNAPTGLCLPLADIEKIAASNRMNIVAIDEAYVDFGGETCIGLIEKYDNLLCVQTFSKSRGLAGARLGFAIGSEAVISDLERLRYSTNPYNVNSMTLQIGIAAMQSGEYYDNAAAKIVETREFVAGKLREMGFSLDNSKTNFLFAKHERVAGKDIYLRLKERGVLVRHFDMPRISDYIRITIGTQEDMEAMLRILSEVL